MNLQFSAIFSSPLWCKYNHEIRKIWTRTPMDFGTHRTCMSGFSLTQVVLPVRESTEWVHDQISSMITPEVWNHRNSPVYSMFELQRKKILLKQLYDSSFIFNLFKNGVFNLFLNEKWISYTMTKIGNNFRILRNFR